MHVPSCTLPQVDFLEKRNESYKTLKFVDISAEDYSPDDNAGISFEAVSPESTSSLRQLLPLSVLSFP